MILYIIYGLSYITFFHKWSVRQWFSRVTVSLVKIIGESFHEYISIYG